MPWSSSSRVRPLERRLADASTIAESSCAITPSNSGRSMTRASTCCSSFGAICPSALAASTMASSNAALRSVLACCKESRGIDAPRGNLNVPQLRVEQMARVNVSQRGEQRVPQHGDLLRQLVDQPLHPLALQVFLTAAQIARNDRELHQLGEARDVGLGRVRERADHG